MKNRRPAVSWIYPGFPQFPPKLLKLPFGSLIFPVLFHQRLVLLGKRRLVFRLRPFPDFLLDCFPPHLFRFVPLPFF
jgi:hypothetical protein